MVRSQIHLQKDGQVHLYSRNCEDRSQSFPDVAEATRAAAAGARFFRNTPALLVLSLASGGLRSRLAQDTL